MIYRKALFHLFNWSSSKQEHREIEMIKLRQIEARKSYRDGKLLDLVSEFFGKPAKDDAIQ